MGCSVHVYPSNDSHLLHVSMQQCCSKWRGELASFNSDLSVSPLRVRLHDSPSISLCVQSCNLPPQDSRHVIQAIHLWACVLPLHHNIENQIQVYSALKAEMSLENGPRVLLLQPEQIFPMLAGR